MLGEHILPQSEVNRGHLVEGRSILWGPARNLRLLVVDRVADLPVGLLFVLLRHSVSSDMAKGERLLKDVYESLRAGPKWEKTLLLVVYDDRSVLDRPQRALSRTADQSPTRHEHLSRTAGQSQTIAAGVGTTRSSRPTRVYPTTTVR